MKYIVTKQDNGAEEIFVFPNAIHHKDMARAVEYLKDHSHAAGWKHVFRGPISAGFVEEGKCVGYSESLNLKSRLEDTNLLPI